MMLTSFDARLAHALPRPAAQGRPAHADPGPRQPHLPRQAGRLLVAYAPLADNLQKALAEYSPADQASKPMGHNLDDAIVLTELIGLLDDLLVGYDWRADYQEPRR